jgi:peptidoglycan/LPS O-acetylase OafA/YrhL
MESLIKDRYLDFQKKIHDFNQSVTNSLELSKSKNHIPVLDGIRGIAILAVLTFHINNLSDNTYIFRPYHDLGGILPSILYFGESGVILFFLLSGFLLFLPYAKALLFDSSWPSIKRFYLRRIFRIIPGYYAALALMILFFHPELLHRSNWYEIWQFLTFRMEFSNSQQINGVFWTLAIEFQFYLLLPILALVFRVLIRHSSLRWRMAKLTCCLLAMMIWGLLTRYYYGVYVFGTSRPHFATIAKVLQPYIYGEMGKFYEVFALGMLLCMVYIFTQNALSAEQWKTKIRSLSPILFIVGLLLLLVMSMWHFYHLKVDDNGYVNVFHIFPFVDPYMRSLGDAWIVWQAFAYTIAYGLCMTAALYGSDSFRRPFEWPVLRWMGFISYSLYMWHLPFIVIFLNYVYPILHNQSFGHRVAYFAFYVWALVVIIPISLTLYRWIEMPGIRVGELVIKMIEKRQRKQDITPVPQNPSPTSHSVDTIAPIMPSEVTVYSRSE